MIARGLFSLMTLAASKNKDPLRLSLKPLRLPIILNGWQGNPAKKISWSGTELADICDISPFGIMPKLLAYTFLAF